MRSRRVITAAVTVAAAAAAMVAAVGTPSYAVGFKTCTPFDQDGWKGDACMSYAGLGGDGELVATAHADSYPTNCATFRIDLIDPYGTRERSTANIPCHTGSIGMVEFAAIGFVKERAYDRLTAFDSAGNSIFSFDSPVFASPYAPPIS
jgi:hypothetical protein